MSRASLSPAQARRIALAAQGFHDRYPAKPDMRSVNRVLARIALLQIDSVNVVSRAHYLPLFSRLGPYDRELLHRAAGKAPRRVFEYWGHVASYIRADLQPALRFRMAAAADDAWGSMQRIWRENPGFVDWVLSEVETRGPLTAREIEHDVPRNKDHWGWNWSEVKIALEWLFYNGAITAARRNSAFERVYDLPERVLPRAVIEAPTPSPEESYRTLLRASANALGVGTEFDLRDYFRLRPEPTKVALRELVEAGELHEVEVEGWKRPATSGTRRSCRARSTHRALLSPFDSLIFERDRTRRLFDYHYRIEIYVPAPKRMYGYYVYSFLLGEQIVARVDLKADRQAGVLQVQGAWAEPSAPIDTAEALSVQLRSMAAWLGLDEVVVHNKGDLAPLLAALHRMA